jgi:hypothetical protein
MCIWVGFQRCKIVLDYCGIYLNMEDEKKYFDEYLTLKKLNLKSKNIYLIIKTIHLYYIIIKR